MEKMNRDESKSKVDHESSSSKSNSFLGNRREEFHVNNLEEQQRLMMFRSQGIMPRPPVFNQHVNHMNNLEEEMRLMRLHYHRSFQAMPRPQHTDPSSSSNTVKAPVYPPGSRFIPTGLGCVRVHLRNKVEKKKSGFITTLDLYRDDPWLLDHVQNDLFLRGEWYYFTPRNKRGRSSCIRRAVRGSGGGGTWKSIGKKKAIMDKDNKVQGYVRKLVYNKTDVNGEIKPTGWSMKEYFLYEENKDDLVLCHLKDNINKKGFAEEEVMKENILPNQVQDHEEEEEEEEDEEEEEEEDEDEEEEAGANGFEMKTTLQEDHGDDTQQQQQQEHDAMAHVLPPHEGQDLGFETTMTMTMTQNNNNFMILMLQEDHGDHPTPQQQQEQDAPVIHFPSHHEDQDPWFEEDLKHDWDDPKFWFSAEELLDGLMEDDVNEGQLQQPDSQAPDAEVGSAD